ncbi:hypothetical protein E3N88_12237 [Mikania micrantha]|uniref:Uncharacterized protein n=1 Tax=Mikania micrantha TaxID=192012 RepID=A0A5N6P691_9ASTR|nr:hypothetical protein E3N88_12237 [Mikania micrantha]
MTTRILSCPCPGKTGTSTPEAAANCSIIHCIIHSRRSRHSGGGCCTCGCATPAVAAAAYPELAVPTPYADLVKIADSRRGSQPL